MQALTQKNILIGISGGIAAYKAAELVRALRQLGANIRVVMTTSACEFITPLTLQTLSGQRVQHDLLDEEAEFCMSHIELARWADSIVIAPATANTIAKLAHGKADDLLTTVCLASPAPLLIAPAMNQQMWRQAATQANIAQLQQRGFSIIGPAEGEQACGDIGPGRLLEVEQIIEQIVQQFHRQALFDQHIVITAGPTREPLDPVRFLSNHSSGKMGFALAQACQQAGARVTLISGPVSLSTPDKVQRIDVESAAQMYQAVHEVIDDCDIFIAAAAVSDYRIAQPATHKIKKTADKLNLTLRKNPDILASVSALAKRPFCVGFCLETEYLEKHALQKMQDKKLDMIVANQTGDDQGFNSDNNQATIYYGKQKIDLVKQSKQQMAAEIIRLLN